MYVDLRRRKCRARWRDRYPPWVPEKVRYPEQPLAWILEESASRFGNRAACRYYDTDWTYGELLGAARKVSRLLHRRGVERGDRVGVLLPNCPEYLATVYGVWMAGGVAVSLSPLMVAEEVSELLIATGCRVVVALDLLASLVLTGDRVPRTVLLATLQHHLPWPERLGYRVARWKRTALRRSRGKGTVLSLTRELDAFGGEMDSPTSEIDGAEPPARRPNVSPDDAALILPTGGTTGAPKAVVLTHCNLLANAWQVRHWAGFPMGRETALAVLPFFHSYGLTTCVTASVALAATLILHHHFQPRRTVRLIERHRPTIFYAVPAMLAALNDELRKRPAGVSSLKLCISGGSPLSASVAEEFAERSGAQVVEGYGLSEASPVTHVGPLDGTARPGTIGLPLPDTEAAIVDLETGSRVLAPGEAGELVVRGPQVMQGYWNDAQATGQVLRDGWLHTGDVATLDEDGFFRIVDRKKDLIITSGFNVYPSDVEHVLRQFPGVADAAVVGVPHPQCGELVKAVLVLNKRIRFSRRAFDRFVREHLAKHRRPRIVETRTTDMPRNFLGKVLRRRLREEHPREPVSETVLVPE
jgi:long-chain acyl-CoA synthetase